MNNFYSSTTSLIPASRPSGQSLYFSRSSRRSPLSSRCSDVAGFPTRVVPFPHWDSRRARSVRLAESMIPSESVAIVWEVFAVVITLAVVAAISRLGNK